MQIIIVGAGRIGKNLAKALSSENSEVFLIESSEEKARKISEKLDAKVLIGNGADPDMLRAAQVDNADLVLAVTTTDETNLVVCSLAGSLGAKRRIARVRTASLSNILADIGLKQFNINEIINPELLAANAIVKIIKAPGASEVADFAGGKLLLRGFDVNKNSPLKGLKLQDLADEDFPWPFLIALILRGENVIVPSGDTTIEEGDHVYVLLPSGSLGEFLTYVNPDIKLPRKVVIYGASITGKDVAVALGDSIRDLIILEEDSFKAEQIAGELSSVRVINGSGCEADILTEVGVEAADAFVATSDNDHSNLISSVLAKKLGAKTTVILTQQPDYNSIVDELDIDAIINPHNLAIEHILHLARGHNIRSVTKFWECDAEVDEFVAEEGSPITQDVVKNIKFPKSAIIGAVYNGPNVSLAKGDTQVQAGDKVIVFCHNTPLKKLQALFSKN